MIKFIENIGDYFSANYFDEDFIKKVLFKSSYSAEDIKEFNKKISPLKDLYYKYKNEYLTLKRPKDKIKSTNKFHTALLNSLGYSGEKNDYAELFLLNDKEGIPVRAKLYRGQMAHLFIMEMQSMMKEGDTPPPGIFEQQYRHDQWEYVFTVKDDNVSLSPSFINQALSELFYIEKDRRPTYVVMLAGSEVYLIHYEKWSRGSYLRFSLEELFDEATLNRDYYSLFYFLISKESLSPDSDIILMDQLDEDSHKSAYAVTQDLKTGVIKAIEDLANEAVFSLQLQNLSDSLDGNFADQLKDECLTFVYRLLFLFYAESREELEILPVNDEVYQKGYGLEMLRDLELVPLQSESSRNGYFFHDSLSQLFLLLSSGFDVDNANTKSVKIRRIDSPLFDDSRFKILNRVKFRNFVLQDIICQLSLSQKQRGKNRGRISYANLGINQLGGVYEGLLSYRGFFADEDYIEVKKADDPTGKDGTYVVPRRRRGDFTEDEILKDSENPDQDKMIPKGRFIYRLSGRDRQKSASYYTPEVLTQTTVKYTLKPILDRLEKDEIKADELLKLKILEPAMGAAAFQNEVINQISEAYLSAKQKETRKKVTPDIYRDELQKVKAFIATNNVYGVDLNPTAVELGKISLWLNVIHKEMETPFFGYRLGVGNAVVGAWRKVYSKKDVIWETIPGGKRPMKKAWWEFAPRHLPWTGKDSKRKPDEVYHFLLPDINMVPSSRIKVLKEEFEDETVSVANKRKSFTEPISVQEFNLLLRISDKIDQLFDELYKNQISINKQTQSNIIVWGQKGHGEGELFSYTDKEIVYNERNKGQAPYYKLKMIMDYWCSLWFWDVREAKFLPERWDFIMDIFAILEINFNELLSNTSNIKNDGFAPPYKQIVLDLTEDPQIRLTEYKSSEEKEKFTKVLAASAEQTDLFNNERWELVKKYSEQYKFFHYELEFIEVFKERGGFDIIVGNPPWVKMTFEEGDIISERYPEVVTQNYTAPQIKEFANNLDWDDSFKNLYFGSLIEAESHSVFSNAPQNYSYLKGQQGNLYKLIISIGFDTISQKGFMGLVHPETVYDDPSGQILRKEIYPRLLYHFHFLNELLLFSEVGDRMLYSLNIYKGAKDRVNFISINNLFHPSTIASSFIHDGSGLCGGFKIMDENTGGFIWNTKPHSDRIICYTESVLKVIAKLFETEADFGTVKLVNIQSSKILSVLERIANFPSKVREFENIITQGWDETNDVNAGKINRKTITPSISDYEMIYSGPHTHVANPLSKTPRSVCTEKAHYDVVDLELIDKNYIQRTNYIPALEKEEYCDAMNGFVIAMDANNKPIYDRWIEYYKLSFSKMLNTSSERTLQPAIIPPRTSHINGISSIIFKQNKRLAEFAALSSSIIYDFLIKTLGTANLTNSRINTLPLGVDPKYLPFLSNRILRLNALNMYYSSLWENLFEPSFCDDGWSIEDQRLPDFKQLSKKWDWASPIRNPFARRWSLIEIDVISAMALNLSLDELITMYNATFALMQQYEDETFYDQNGRIVFTTNRAITGVGVDRKKWGIIKNNKEGEFVEHFIDYELHRGAMITYYPPFEKCNRIEDYKRAWAHFEKIFEGK